MTLDQIMSAICYLVVIFILFIVGKWVYDKLNRQFVLKDELIKHDNLAIALAICGYYFGLLIAVGGVLEGPSFGLLEDLMDLLYYGIVSILLLNVSVFINNKLILYKFDNIKEMVQDQNAGTGIVEAANHIAVGMVISGAMSGNQGDLVTAGAFWGLGQIVLVLAGIFYNKFLPFDLHDEIEKDNVAVGVAFAGVLIAIGNIVRIGAGGDFVSWSYNLSNFGGFVLWGFIMLPVLRWMTDRILLPGERLTDELIHQEKPNIGAGVLEAFSYIGVSFLLGWVA